MIEFPLAEQVQRWARARLAPDPNAGGIGGDAYAITSLYFDTERGDVFHRRGSFGRSKYRIRRYGEGEVAFLERKLRTRGLLCKRRSLATLEELARLGQSEPERGWSGAWFHRRLLARELRPVCQLSYHRNARVAMTPHGPIRLTLDRNLRALPADGLRFREELGALVLADRVVLELKFRYEMPLLFKYLVEEFALNARPFSKYRLAAGALRLVPDAPRDALETPVLCYA